MRLSSNTSAIVLAFSMGAFGCEAALGDTRDHDDSGSDDRTLFGDGDSPNALDPKERSTAGATLEPCTPGALEQMPTRLLTNDQLRNLWSRVFPGVDLGGLVDVPQDDQQGGFVVGTSIVDDLRLSALDEVARTVASHVTSEFSTLSPDCSDADDESCVEGYLAKVGRLLFRRALSEDEIEGFLQLHRDTGGGGSGLGYLTRALLLSGEALYHVEEPVEERARVTGTEMATKLALLLWDDAPDEELLDAAEAGDLDTAEGVEEWAKRMLESDAALPAIERFYAQWLGYEERLEDPELTEAAARELGTFASALTVDEDTVFNEFFTSTRAHLDQRLADLYEVEGDFSTPRWGELNPAERAGILTRASFLLDTGPQTSPTVRGQHVRERLLCQQLPSVPGDVDFPPFQEDLTPREFVEYHLSAPSCAACHQFIDPIGLAFEQYDETGAFRSEYAIRPGETIDPSGEIVAYPQQPTDLDGPFEDVRDLSARMGESETVRHCFTEKWYRFTLARSLTAADTCELEQLNARFAAAGQNPRSYLLSLVQSPGFSTREPNDE